MVEKQRSQSQGGRAWTKIELAYFAIVLADEKNDFAVRLDTLALKKTANDNLFTEISEAFQERLFLGSPKLLIVLIIQTSIQFYIEVCGVAVVA